MQLSAAIFPVLLMRTLRPEHSNDLPKETHLAGGRSSNWTQAIWCYSQKSVPLHFVASMEDNFVFRPVRIDHWRMILIPAYASDTGAFALRRIFPTRYEYVCGDITFIRQTEKEREKKEIMYTIKLTEVTLGGFCFVFLSMPHGTWDLSSPTRDWTRTLRTGSMES